MSWGPPGPLRQVRPAGAETTEPSTPRAAACPLFWTVAVTVISCPTVAVAGEATGLVTTMAAVSMGQSPARTWKAASRVALVP
jgi:hypothetical protein